MFVLHLMIILAGGPQGVTIKSPPVLPLFDSEAECEAVKDEMAAAIKRQFPKGKVAYSCTAVVPVHGPKA